MTHVPVLASFNLQAQMTLQTYKSHVKSAVTVDGTFSLSKHWCRFGILTKFTIFKTIRYVEGERNDENYRPFFVGLLVTDIHTLILYSRANDPTTDSVHVGMEDAMAGARTVNIADPIPQHASLYLKGYAKGKINLHDASLARDFLPAAIMFEMPAKGKQELM